MYFPPDFVQIYWLVSILERLLLKMEHFLKFFPDLSKSWKIQENMEIPEYFESEQRQSTKRNRLEFFFFFKIYFYYFFIGKADIQRGETERKIFRPMIHSPSERNGPMLCRSEARSLFRVSHAGAGSQRTGAHMGSRACKARTFNHLRHRAGPFVSFLMTGFD